MADKYATDVHRSFRRLRLDVRADKTSRYETGMFKGRSDLVVSGLNKSTFIEIKTASATSFPTRKWTSQQREFALWAENINRTDYYVFLTVGRHRPQNKKPIIAGAYLIPHRVFRQLVDAVEVRRKSIPVRTAMPRSKRQSPKPCIERDFSAFKLDWVQSDLSWAVPEGHPFYEKYKELICEAIGEYRAAA